MRIRLPALGACLLAAAPALAQTPAPPPAPAPSASPFTALTTAVGNGTACVSCGGGPAADAGYGEPPDAPVYSGAVGAGGPRVYGMADYTLWWISPFNAPALIQTVPSGVVAQNIGGQLPAGSAQPFFPGRRTEGYGPFSGVRATAGVGLERFGLEVSGFYLDERTVGASLFNSGTPYAIARSYVSAGAGTDTSLFFSLQDRYSGGATVDADARLWGLEANARLPWYALFSDWTNALIGVRHVNLEEGLNIQSRLTLNDGRGSLLVNDSIRTRNQFYGFNLGFHGRIGACDRGFGVEAVTKLAMGWVHQQVDIAGSNTILSPTAPPDTALGGLYAQRTNIGSYSRNKFAVVPELNVNLTYNFTPGAQVFVGYSLLWVSSVQRPGEAIDPVVNDSNVRYVANPTPSLIPRPAFFWRANDLYMQGLNFGVRLQY